MQLYPEANNGQKISHAQRLSPEGKAKNWMVWIDFFPNLPQNPSTWGCWRAAIAFSLIFPGIPISFAVVFHRCQCWPF